MKKLIFLAITGMFVSGCTTTEMLDTANMVSVAVDGKTFNIPSGAIPSPHLATPVEVDFFKRSGVSECKEGDIIWEAASVKDEVSNAIKNGDASIHQDLAKAGKIGCASPIK